MIGAVDARPHRAVLGAHELLVDHVLEHLEQPAVEAAGVQQQDRLVVDAQGDLVLQTAGGHIRLHKPILYQEVDGARQVIAGSYALKDTRHVGPVRTTVSPAEK